MKTALQIGSLVVVLGLTALPLQAYENDCCNDCQPTPAPSCPAVNPIHPGMANLHRQVTDLQTYGAAPIRFTRIFNSRTTNFNDWYWDFGARQTWQHNWNYEVRQLTSKTFNQFDIKVRYPDGLEYNFKAASATSNQFIPPADNGDRLYKWSGSTVGYTLITPGGKEYDFWRYLSPKFHLTELRDGQGLKWTFTYNSDTTLKRISNAFGRWIELERTSVNGVLCITRVFANDGRQVSYGYSPWTPTGSVVLTTVTYPAGEQAHYTWATADPTVPTARPVLQTASDPLFPGAGARTSYVYNYDARFNYGAGPYLVTGMVKEERNLDEDSGILSLPLGGGHYPQILEGDGTEITRKFLYGLLTESRDGENRTNYYTYTAGGFGYLETLTEPNGAVTVYNRDYAGRLLSQTDLMGNTRSSVFNLAGFEISRTDERNNTTTTVRDSGNRPVRIDYPDGTYETWTYNTYGQELQRRARNGGLSAFVYYNGSETGGKLGDLKSVVDPLGNVTTFTYADSGLRSTVRDARNNTSTFVYNWRGKLETVTRPDGTVVRTEYDAFGNKTRQINELGQAWVYTYDEFNHLASSTDPLGRATTFEYGLDPECPACNSAGALTRVTLPSGTKTEYQYDRSWRQTARIVGAGTADAATTGYEYAASGDLSAVVDGRGKRTLFTYDLLHRRTSVTDPLGQASTFTYDGAGNKVSETRPDNGVTTRAYDSMNRLTQTTNPKNETIRFSYGAGKNITGLIDSRDNAYSFEYDGLNRKTKMTYPDQSFEQWTFDSVGNNATYRTRGGQIKTFTYDNRNRQTLADWSDSTPDVTSVYDNAGRLLTLTSSVSTLSYTYDNAGLLLSETQQIAADGGPKSVLYTYNADGQRATISYPSGGSVTLGYNHRDQLNSVMSGDLNSTYSYDLNGNRLDRSYGNGTTADFAYDDAGRVATVDNQKNGESFARYDYTYNGANQRATRTETTGGASGTATTDDFSYDPVDQVVQARYNFDAGGNTQDRLVTYGYDPAGSRTSVGDNGATTTYLANPLNQYTAVDGDAPTYDPNGALKTQDGWTYTYDAQSRLTSAQSAQALVSLSYDGRNRCVSRTINGVTTFLYWSAWSLLEEQNSSGNLLARYVHGTNVDEMIARITPSQTSYYHHDALGSVIALTGTNGAVSERYKYSVFGTPTFQDANGNVVSGSVSGNSFLFTGRDYMAPLALYDFRNRVYSPAFGRFLQPDPARFSAKDANIYRYVRNNPINGTDPMGLGTCVDGVYHSDGGPPPSGVSSNYQECYNDANATRNWEVNENCYECDSFDRIVPIDGCAADREQDLIGMLEVCKSLYCGGPKP